MADRRPAGRLTATTAVIGAGVIGCAVAWVMAREGRRVLLVDRDQPATAGASFGNVGHIATEQVQPLPSIPLLLRGWRELYAFGGPLDIPLARLPALAPWLTRFVAAASRQREHTPHLAALVRGAADALDALLGQIGRRDLLRRHGHYSVWLGGDAHARTARQRLHFQRLGVQAQAAPRELIAKLAQKAGGGTEHRPAAAGLWLPGTAHVLDPAEVARAMAGAAMQRGTSLLRATVVQLAPHADGVEVTLDDGGRITVESAVVCAGVWSAPLLAPFGLKAPLEAERGYHVELPGHEPLADAPIVYANDSIVVTPMAGRLRSSSYLELAGLNAPPDPRKGARLRARLAALGYSVPAAGPAWMGPRPTLPDYLPGIGRAAGVPGLLYAVGHQHLGLTLAAPTAELIAQLAAGRRPGLDISAFDLARFGHP
jgi:glycine/D-amino acid oxidase-like deaminating enzyme